MKIHDTILDAIGNTPLVRLNDFDADIQDHIGTSGDFQLYRGYDDNGEEGVWGIDSSGTTDYFGEPSEVDIDPIEIEDDGEPIMDEDELLGTKYKDDDDVDAFPELSSKEPKDRSKTMTEDELLGTQYKDDIKKSCKTIQKNLAGVHDALIRTGATTTDSDHSHSYQLDRDGNGKTTGMIGEYGTEHMHDIKNYEVKPAQNHIHMI